MLSCFLAFMCPPFVSRYESFLSRSLENHRAVKRQTEGPRNPADPRLLHYRANLRKLDSIHHTFFGPNFSLGAPNASRQRRARFACVQASWSRWGSALPEPWTTAHPIPGTLLLQNVTRGFGYTRIEVCWTDSQVGYAHFEVGYTRI